MARGTPPSLTALGRDSLPQHLVVGTHAYERRCILKNDFFAATGVYEGDLGRVVLKAQRQASFLGIPLQWMGRVLAARERRALERLSDLPGVPRLLGSWGKTGLVREYIEGRTLADVEHVDDDFHPRLRALIEAIHARGMAYVDLEKPSNVLVGEDGRPYLFDFQICWYLPRRWGGELAPARMLRRWLQAGDLYHLAKLQRRSRPDQLSPGDRAASYRLPWFVRVHRILTRPLTRIRRWILSRVDPQRKRGERGRITDHPFVKGF